MTDRYTRAVLTVIAIALSVIAVKMWAPAPAYAGFMGGPTLEDIQKGQAKPAEAPVVYVINMR